MKILDKWKKLSGGKKFLVILLTYTVSCWIYILFQHPDWSAFTKHRSSVRKSTCMICGGTGTYTDDYGNKHSCSYCNGTGIWTTNDNSSEETQSNDNTKSSEEIQSDNTTKNLPFVPIRNCVNCKGKGYTINECGNKRVCPICEAKTTGSTIMTVYPCQQITLK